MSPASRPAFTIIELLVAVVLVAIGVLATVGSSAVIVREEDDGRSMAAAASVAANRLEWLRSHPCAQENGHADGAKGETESWSATVLASGVRDLADSVSFVAGGRPRVFVLHTQAWC